MVDGGRVTDTGVTDTAVTDTAASDDGGHYDFFVSYTGVDAAWAQWIA
ncbi:hypothetical protein [Frankia sp. Cas4]|nr:hypothetical protein [Frankia sp. Cas4]